MQASDVLTDEFIERIADRFVESLPNALPGRPAYNENRLRHILVDVLRDERQPVYKFVVEVKADHVNEAMNRLPQALWADEGIRVIPPRQT